MLKKFLFLCILVTCQGSLLRESCFSPIYCHGELLHLIQTSGIFNDSKTFVDLSMIHSVNVTLESFFEFLVQTRKKPTITDIKQFVYQNFHSVGEIEEYWPPDYDPAPDILFELEDHVVRKYTSELISLWPTLARRVTRPVMEEPQSYSIIPVPHGFIIPGGRFKEIYYWDTFWIVHGLLISGMNVTAEGMVDNLLSLVNRYGYVPNGTRVYYLNRSQPPLLVLMVALYVRITRNLDFLEKSLPILEKEMEFWLTKRVVQIEKNGTIYRLATYGTQSDTPRPESYAEDIENCEFFQNEEERAECFMDMKAGAESGWDFTTRWIFDNKGSPYANLSHIQTRRNVPADLNAFLYMDFMTMYKMFLKLNMQRKAHYYYELGQEWKRNIEKFLWCEEDGIWYDYDLKLEKHRRYFYMSNFTPLWAKAMELSDMSNRIPRILQYIITNGILDFHGGTPSSFIPSGQQWDYPNAWSPSQTILIFALEFSGNPEAKDVAKQLAHTWIRSNIKAYNENKVMFEKYNAENSGQFGGGGEYLIQSGFGWTNGVMLELIDYYYRIPKPPVKKKQSKKQMKEDIQENLDFFP